MQTFFNKLNTLYKKSSPYLIAILILAIPLYPKFPFITLPGSYVGIRIEDFLLGFIAVFFVLGNLVNTKQILNDRSIQLLALFTAIGLVSVVSAILITQTVVPALAVLHWIRRIEYMFCFALGYLAISKKEHIRFYIICIAVVIVYSFFYGVGQKYFNWPIVTTQNEEYAKGIALQYVEGGHLVATFAGHYDMASFLILAMPVILGLIASSSRKIKELGYKFAPSLMRILFAICFLMGLWLLTMAASRISVISYLLSCVLLLIFMRKYLFIPLLLIATLLISLTSGSLIARYTNIYDVTIKKIISIEIVPSVHAADAPLPTEDRSTNIRLNVEWPRAIRAVERNPFFGTGYSSITLATDNDYLRMLGETGILGAFSFALLIIHICSYLFKKSQKVFKGDIDTIFAAAIFCAIPGVFLNMVFIDILEASKFAIMFWLFLGIAYKIARQPQE